jgi:hydroxyacylglutathione hydrolase
MLQIHSFTFGPFAENTYVVYDGSGEAVVFDPGCYDAAEESAFAEFIRAGSLRLRRLVNTHAHIDHVLGNYFIHDKYGLLPEMHELELSVLSGASGASLMYGLRYSPSPEPALFFKEGEILELGNHAFEIRLAPGHSPGSLVFVHHQQRFVIGGDVLFRQSIGRSDLPGGDHETLLASIRSELYSLPDDYTVYPGHGPATTIGFEKQNNPFVRS